MLEEDIEEKFTTADFRQAIDPSNPGNILYDLTQSLIERAITVGSNNLMQSSTGPDQKKSIISKEMTSLDPNSTIENPGKQSAGISRKS